MTFLCSCVHETYMGFSPVFCTYVDFSACIHKIYDMISVILLLVSLFIGS
jgi:uncharacterized membrane protein YtjA (UPF0391 family)